MTGKDAIRYALGSTNWVLNSFVRDFTDAELLVRPVPGANHAAWQLGHLIAAEPALIMGELPAAKYPDFPTGFVAAHAKDRAIADGADGFLTKAGYLGLFEQIRAATLSHLDALADADLDKPVGPTWAPFAPTIGAFFLFVSNHTQMHAGQITAIRRKLGKPVVF